MVFLLEFEEERVRGFAVKAIDPGEMEALARERSNCREKIAIIKGLLAINDGALPDP